MAIAPLIMADGTKVRSVESLREHFDLESVLKYYINGNLQTWLKQRGFPEAAAVEALDAAAPDLQQKLCDIFGVAYAGEAIDLEKISRRQERLEKLRAFTTEAKFIGHIDQVAFDQGELEGLLDKGETTIYLCGEKFTVPASRKGTICIGVNMPVVHISGTLPNTGNDVGVSFIGCEVDNLIGSPVNIKDIEKANQHNEVISFETETKQCEILSDLIRACGLNIIETENYYLAEYSVSYLIVVNKCSGESRKIRLQLKDSYPRIDWLVGKSAIIKDTIYYKDEDSLYSFNLHTLAVEAELPTINPREISACGSEVAIIDSDKGMCLYNIREKTCKSIIPLRVSNASYLDRGILATPEGIYFTCRNNDGIHTLEYYRYSTKKREKVFKLPFQCTQIYAYKAGNIFYLSNETWEKIYKACSAKEYVEYNPLYAQYISSPVIHAYSDEILFVSEEGDIASIDYEAGTMAILASDAKEDHYVEGGLFKKSSSWETPVTFFRSGNYIFYYSHGNCRDIRRLNLQTNDMEILPYMDYHNRDQYISGIPEAQ